MKRKRNKNKKIRLLIFGSLSIITIIYFISSLFTYSLDIKNLRNEEIALKSKLENLKEGAEDLKLKIEKLKDPEYKARFVRENFLYSKKTGEYIIKLQEKKEEKIEITNKEDNKNIYFIIGIGIVLLFIIVYVIKKR